MNRKSLVYLTTIFGLLFLLTACGYKSIEHGTERTQEQSDKIKGGTGGSLRSQTGTFSKAYIVKMIRDKGFNHPYDQSSWQLSSTVRGNVQHKYVQKTIAGKKVVLDQITGLMWQQSGSPQTMSWAEAHDYVQEMNQGSYAGFSDWRLPTIEELASLLESEKKNGDLYIDPVFDPEQQWCWSGDKMKEDAAKAWRVHFQLGGVDGYLIKRNITYVRAVRTL